VTYDEEFRSTQQRYVEELKSDATLRQTFMDGLFPAQDLPSPSPRSGNVHREVKIKSSLLLPER
jgi:hypothetical protein